MADRTVESVINQFKQRSQIGIKKYMDFCLYLERLKHEFNNQNK